MPQLEIEMILMRQLASYLAMPIFIVDPVGNLVFYNEPAESILGRRF
jgi:PAS domain-containing protein